MKKIVRLTESDLVRIVKRVINEQKYKFNPVEGESPDDDNKLDQLENQILPNAGYKRPSQVTGHPAEKYCMSFVRKVDAEDLVLYTKGSNIVCLSINPNRASFKGGDFDKMDISFDELLNYL
jgi:hypothetical protein